MPYSLDSKQTRTYLDFAKLKLPRHTSYPPANHWAKGLGKADIQVELNSLGNSAVSLYIHVPFCEKLCYYCACSKLVVPREDKEDSQNTEEKFLVGLEREVRRLADCAPGVVIEQLHLGGGTPTYLSPKNLERMLDLIHKYLKFSPMVEMSCEIDPRVTSVEHLATLRSLGFQRLSLGVQDFDPKVQNAIHRFQSFELVNGIMSAARELGFPSINFDLIYGLPFQSEESMRKTLDEVLKLSPDRIAFFRLALIPDLFRAQRLFSEADIPEGELPLKLMQMAIKVFTENGYEFIGLDHFAKRSDSLDEARRSRKLQRNFQGMSTGKALPIIGLGPSAISSLPGAFWQNTPAFHRWFAEAEQDFPIEKGHTLSEDDKRRNFVIQEIYCERRISKSVFEREFHLNFDEYFIREKAGISDLVKSGLLIADEDGFYLSQPLGHFLARVVASVFDAFLPSDAYRSGSSQGSRVG